MNQRKIKRINKQVGIILVDWLRTLVSEDTTPKRRRAKEK